MRKLVITLLLFACALSVVFAYGAAEEVNSRSDYGSFDSIQIKIPATVQLVRGDEHRVEADVARRFADEIRIRNDRRILVIEARRPRFKRFKSTDIRFRITLPEFEEISLAGSGSVSSDDSWQGNRIRLLSSGSGEMRFTEIDAAQAELRLTGSGGIDLEDLAARRAELLLSGSGDLEIDRISAGDAEIRITGSGRFQGLIEADRLDSTQTGSGDIRIEGRVGKAEIRTTGSGDFDGRGLQAEEADVTMTGSGGIRLYPGVRLGEIRMTGSGNFIQE